jgi:Raf kinase inhibitor-like YbhB/YbcL family protein
MMSVTVRQSVLPIVAAILVVSTATSVCTQGEGQEPKGAKAMAITLTSSAFSPMQAIPAKYTCDGADVSPPLAWKGVPDTARSLVLISDDPDAPMGTWVHWVCYDIPPTVDSLAENIPKTDSLPCGGQQGTTDFRRVGYGGPCPPGGTHRYFFKVYALDATLGLPAGSTKKEVEKAMRGHVLAQGELVGKYSRQR